MAIFDLPQNELFLSAQQLSLLTRTLRAPRPHHRVLRLDVLDADGLTP